MGGFGIGSMVSCLSVRQVRKLVKWCYSCTQTITATPCACPPGRASSGMLADSALDDTVGGGARTRDG